MATHTKLINTLLETINDIRESTITSEQAMSICNTADTVMQATQLDLLERRYNDSIRPKLLTNIIEAEVS